MNVPVKVKGRLCDTSGIEKDRHKKKGGLKGKKAIISADVMKVNTARGQTNRSAHALKHTITLNLS